MESLRRRGWGAPVDASAANAYRPDIDGLRALAVLPVILFHAHLFFPGGFVGVDVFFVISGYLITQIIERDLQAHRFSVLVFYQRRIRRIFPALFVMCACSILLAYVLLVPDELRDFGKTLLASSAFSSNILFYRWSGYFAPDSEFAPLLHTWTLSVEEQFYVCWPLLLRVLSLPWAARWKTLAAVSILGGSLTLSAYWVGHDSNAAFYLLPSRAWELALGALLGLFAGRHRSARPRPRHV
jgi:peptidoglycan/LPS O-acetylase OafA/YrhL